MQKIKRKPAYYSECLRRKDRDLFFIAKDWNALNLIRHLGGRNCLLCEDAPKLYDLSFCWSKEIWVLYSTCEMFSAAMELARTIQRMGAIKVCLIQVRMATMQEAERNGY